VFADRLILCSFFVPFIDENSGASGVRFRKPMRGSSSMGREQ
jgi:hypothetical protein